MVSLGWNQFEAGLGREDAQRRERGWAARTPNGGSGAGQGWPPNGGGTVLSREEAQREGRDYHASKSLHSWACARAQPAAAREQVR